ncbi:MAG: tryptophan-rich sensory protein [Cyclobacteriaceae bacterium]|nr:tryptophan-rich sensory protein [Cyclobacteriaceae bacterium]
MKKSIILVMGNSMALLGVLAVNALANILPINGMNTGQVSALYPSLFTPAGITFSIWSIIYLLLIGFVVRQWLKVRNETLAYREISFLFILSCVFNMTWIIAWHFLQVWLSVGIMLSLLVTLIIIFLRLEKHTTKGFADSTFIKLPFTIYLAWICVATIANISTALVSENWHGVIVSEDGWTIVLMGIATLLAFYITLCFTKPAFSAVVIWALVGIFLRWKGTEYTLIASSAIIMTILLGGVFLYSLWRSTFKAS